MPGPGYSPEYPNKESARTSRAGVRPHRHIQRPPGTFQKAEITFFLNKHLPKCDHARLIFFWLRQFGYSREDPNTPPTTRRRRRPEGRKSPHPRSRAPSRAWNVCAVGMTGLWCSSRARACSCGVSRREAQGRIKHKPPQWRGGMCLGMWDAPRGTGSVFTHSMIVLNVPRRLRWPNRAGSTRNVNNNS